MRYFKVHAWRTNPMLYEWRKFRNSESIGFLLDSIRITFSDHFGVHNFFFLISELFYWDCMMIFSASMKLALDFFIICENWTGKKGVRENSSSKQNNLKLLILNFYTLKITTKPPGLNLTYPKLSRRLRAYVWISQYFNDAYQIWVVKIWDSYKQCLK